MMFGPRNRDNSKGMRAFLILSLAVLAIALWATNASSHEGGYEIPAPYTIGCENERNLYFETFTNSGSSFGSRTIFREEYERCIHFWLDFFEEEG